jgi:hypothetical protein
MLSARANRLTVLGLRPVARMIAALDWPASSRALMSA